MNDLSALSVALRIALGVAALVAGWWLLGPVGLVTMSPVPAILLARPILDIAAGTVRSAKTLALRSVEGAYYTFRGVPVAVYEDEFEHRWIAIADVRTILPFFPRNAVLKRVFPSGVVSPDRNTGPVVRADELIAFLFKAEQADAVKFKNWLQRDVYFPSGGAKRAGATPISPATDEKAT